MIYFDKSGKQIREGKVLRRLDKVGNNSRGNGKKHFYSYWLVVNMLDQLCLLKVNTNIRDNPTTKVIRRLVNNSQVLERHEVI